MNRSPKATIYLQHMQMIALLFWYVIYYSRRELENDYREK